MTNNLYAQKIRQARRAANLTQEAFAEKCGVSRVTVSNWEGGKTAPDAVSFVRIAKALGVSVDYLLDNDSQPNTPSPPPPEPSPEPTTRRPLIRKMTRIPVVSRELTACCGDGILFNEITQDEDSSIMIFDDVLRGYDDLRRPYGVYCDGSCMESAGIYDGDIAVINPAEMPIQGAAAMVSVHDSMSIKYVFQLRNGDIILRSDSGNKKLTPAQQEGANFKILGTVVSVVRKRPKPCSYL